MRRESGDKRSALALLTVGVLLLGPLLWSGCDGLGLWGRTVTTTFTMHVRVTNPQDQPVEDADVWFSARTIDNRGRTTSSNTFNVNRTTDDQGWARFTASFDVDEDEENIRVDFGADGCVPEEKIWTWAEISAAAGDSSSTAVEAYAHLTRIAIP